MKKAVEIIEPHIKKKNVSSKGLVMVGTVAGDVHDIGKMVLAIILESNGFTVIDLGVDVSNDTFIEKVEQLHPDILAMSSLLTSTLSSMEDIIKGLKRENLRNKVKIIIGGRAVTEEFAKKIAVDAYGKDVIDGLNKCVAIMEENR
jgi:5-methyltetrahydrofolate--homocysteine methyltransferase